jgi:hypothetical protein
LARSAAGAGPFEGLFDFAASAPPDEKNHKTAPEAVIRFVSNNLKKRKNYNQLPFMPANKISSSQNLAATRCGREKNRLPKRQAARRPEVAQGRGPSRPGFRQFF